MVPSQQEPSVGTLISRFQSFSLNSRHLPVSGKHAAVLVPLFWHEHRLCVLLTQRSKHVGSHQGEVCFPGGKRDPNDADDTATALREAWEELGLPPASVQVIALLPPVLSKHFLSVTPVVGIVPPTRAAHAPSPSISEVAAVFHVPLSLFVEGGPSHSFRDITWESHCYRIHFFEHEGFNIWGLTAGILIQVAQIALGQPPAFVEHAPLEIGGVFYSCFRHDGQRLQVDAPVNREQQSS